MDPANEIVELEAKCVALGKALAVPGISEAERIAIRNHLTAITGEMTMLGHRLAKVEDGRWVNNPYVQFVGFTGAGMIASGWACYYPGYCTWRHKRWFPYHERQIFFRRQLFGADFPQSIHPSAHRLPKQLFQICLASSVAQRALEWWRQKKGPKSPPPRN